jgi:transposase
MPGDVAVMDNPDSHKRKAVRAAIRATGAHLLFLPPCSPDLDPIEQVIAKLKHPLHKAAKRTSDNTSRCIGDLANAFAPGECANYLVNSEHASA